jgi:hypothetical protein
MFDNRSGATRKSNPYRRREEFEERVSRQTIFLSAKPYSMEERSMQLNALADAGASANERAPFVKALKAAQSDGSWPASGIAPDAYATGEASMLCASGDVQTNDTGYQKVSNGCAKSARRWVWFAPTRAVPCSRMLKVFRTAGINCFDRIELGHDGPPVHDSGQAMMKTHYSNRNPNRNHCRMQRDLLRDITAAGRWTTKSGSRREHRSTDLGGTVTSSSGRKQAYG